MDMNITNEHSDKILYSIHKKIRYSLHEQVKARRYMNIERALGMVVRGEIAQKVSYLVKAEIERQLT